MYVLCVYYVYLSVFLYVCTCIVRVWLYMCLIPGAYLLYVCVYMWYIYVYHYMCVYGVCYMRCMYV